MGRQTNDVVVGVFGLLIGAGLLIGGICNLSQEAEHELVWDRRGLRHKSSHETGVSLAVLGVLCLVCGIIFASRACCKNYDSDYDDEEQVVILTHNQESNGNYGAVPQMYPQGSHQPMMFASPTQPAPMAYGGVYGQASPQPGFGGMNQPYQPILCSSPMITPGPQPLVQ